MKLLSLILNQFKKLPKLSTLDRSGIVKSDHPVPGNGWIKGWVMNVPSKNVVLVCKHANPSTSTPNNKIYVNDASGVKHERTIIAIDKEPFDIGSDDSYYDGGDIALCKLDRPLPETIASYDIYYGDHVYNMKTAMYNQNDDVSSAKIVYRGKIAYLKGVGRDVSLEPGDSGLPWFVYDGKWKVLSHTFRGWHGEGPWYGRMYDEIMRRARSLGAS